MSNSDKQKRQRVNRLQHEANLYRNAYIGVETQLERAAQEQQVMAGAFLLLMAEHGIEKWERPLETIQGAPVANLVMKLDGNFLKIEVVQPPAPATDTQAPEENANDASTTPA